MKHTRSVLIVLATLMPLTTVAQAQRAPFTPVTDAMLEKPDPATGRCGGARLTAGVSVRSIR